MKWLRCKVEGNKVIMPKDVRDHVWIIGDANSTVGDTVTMMDIKSIKDRRGFTRIYVRLPVE